jgi:microcompartment protein CcmL/EutN
MASHFYRVMNLTVAEDTSPKTLDQVMKAARGAIISYREIGDGKMVVRVRTQASKPLSEKVQANILKAVQAIVPNAEWE